MQIEPVIIISATVIEAGKSTQEKQKKKKKMGKLPANAGAR